MEEVASLSHLFNDVHVSGQDFSSQSCGRAVVIIHYTIIINVKNVHFLATKSSQVQAAATQQSSCINNTIMASGAVPIFQCGRLTRNMNIINTGLILLLVSY